MIGSHLTPLAISTRLPPQIPSLIAPRLPINLFLLRRSSTSLRCLTPRLAMAARDHSYEAALNCLSSLITRRIRADVSNKGDSFYVMFDYLKMLDLEEEVQKLKVVHVAGTKGKGSTCTFTESILRNCGFHTGLFTSPHLIDVRERFRLDGVEISEEKFLEYFWWCWDRFQERTGGDVPMPIYFRFLTLLAFKIFTAEKVDVAVLEVGLGGKFDSTNVVQAPIVCGISSLGYDHMEILGNTLGEIAGEKAGIFKQGVPAYTMPQPEEAMSVLEAKASEFGISLQVVPPLDIGLLKGQRLGLDGEHQYLNAGLAVALSRTWLQRTGHTEDLNLDHADSLPDPFIRGLVMAHLQGRAQIVPDQDVMTQNQNFCRGGLVYYLDGAHSPESIEMCARWFSHVSGKNTQQSDDLKEQYRDYLNTKRILLFNCMSVRDPQLLLPRLVNTCAHHGVHFDKALFVPNQSLFNKVGSYASVPAADSQQVDLSWQLALQRVWESLNRGDNESGDDKIRDTHEGRKSAEVTNAKGYESSLVFPSIPLALKWIKETVQQSPSIRFQVLVTGSLHLVGDVLKLIKK